MRLFLLALLSVACKKENPDDTAPPAADLDQDGYVAVEDGGDDCDDEDAAVHPNADEVCNEVDDDCDGLVDEDGAVGAPTWYLDGDADGYGGPTVTATVCTAPEGYVAEGTDCNDDDAAISPVADEICDEVDNDCDGEIDEPDAVGAPTWYADADLDGFGDAAVTTIACLMPSGYVADATDCDDAQASVFPGATEYCDGVDHDCDGLTDEDDSADAGTWYADADADGYGDVALTAVACATPSGFVADATDCDDAQPSVFPGAEEHCDGVDHDCDGLTDEDDSVDAPTWYADADADGWGDAAVSAVACAALSGFVADATDCDDAQPSVFPGADELCDGVDHDCDGLVDEDSSVDAVTWYADTDADGFGDAAVSAVACTVPSGFVADATDCDDTQPGVYPGADEFCDGVDHDCDGLANEDDSVDAGTWYADADSDGYGDAASTTLACSAPVGFVADATDCDDAQAEISPSAIELCNGWDDDCDGALDEDDALDALAWYADSDADGFGNPLVFTLACAAPAGFLADDSDCDDSSATVYPWADEYCDGVDHDCDGLTDEVTSVDAGTWYADTDTDGYGNPASTTRACSLPAGFVADATDCNDGAAGVYPGAAEYCDGVDHDCDGLANETTSVDAATWYADGDTDGYGNPASSTRACTLPTGYVADATDCNDGAANVHPGAAEYCGGVDYDCDGLANEPTSLDAATWYTDADTDGYGNPASTTRACSRPTGYVADATDCNDGAANVHPGAAEYCDSVDHDCDGLINESSSVDAATWYADADVDGYGDAAATQRACSVPAGYCADDTDCDDADGAVHPGADEICNDGVDNDCDGSWEPCDMSLADADLTLTGTAASENTGISAAPAGDVDGDGHPDLIIGANGAASGQGAAYLFYGPVTDLGTATAASLADARLLGGTGQYAGRQVGGGGDLDGDGLDDLIVSAPAASTSAGVTWIVTSAPTGDVSLSTAATILVGEGSYDYAGFVTYVAGDLDGDGHDDLVVDAYAADHPVAHAGASYVFYGPLAAGSANVTSADAVVQGASVDCKFGYAGARVGDVDGDGNDDLLTGAYAMATNTGAVYLDYGPLAGTSSMLDSDLILVGEAVNDFAGIVVGRADDFDGDGYADFLVGAPGQDGGVSNGGAAYLVLGPGYSGSLASADAKIVGDESGGNLGWQTMGYADIDDDGQNDLVLGANNEGPTSQGAMFVLRGPVTGTVSAADADATLWGKASNDYVGVVAAAVEDLDGTGTTSLILGARDADPVGSGSGEVYFLYGLGF